ncbi:hypothetical protein CEP54_001525 [Fusarium duplospermum]|uniref:asparaginase n=1 Tax=Fusarium duplospermum TaxID=1325734 RepID=A0A428R0I9_9HYPO|nr:hypothetical protein CEP54_001525 [Fusarium duplospermum]
MTHLGLTLSDQAQEKRLIRKSGSLSVALKSLLKVIPILTTIILAIKETRLPAAPSLSVGVATCVAMGMATYFVSVPLAKATQARKASRDDKVESNSSKAPEAQAHYTASAKTKAKYRSAWQVVLFISIVLIFLFLADEYSMAIWLRLGHQFLSIDETYDKFAQSYPKVTPILKAMRSGPATGGTIAGAADSSARTTEYESGALGIDEIIRKSQHNWRNDAVVNCRQLMNVDSLKIDSPRAIEISQHVTEVANNPHIQGIVLLLGTDLMSEVAALLALTVTTHKPIVITGARLPHTAISADGPGNMLAAVRTAAASGWSSEGQEVVIVIENKIMAPWGTKKENNQFLPGPGSLLGEIKDFRPFFRWSSGFRAPRKFDLGGLSPGTPLPEVVRVDAHQDFRVYLVEAAIANGAKGIVLVGYGDGYWPEASAQQIKKLVDETDVVMVFAAEEPQGVIAADVGRRRTIDQRQRLASDPVACIVERKSTLSRVSIFQVSTVDVKAVAPERQVFRYDMHVLTEKKYAWYSREEVQRSTINREPPTGLSHWLVN